MDVSRLPSSIRQSIDINKVTIRQIEQQWRNLVILDNSIDVSVYDYYPYLFIDAFPGITTEQIAELSLASRFFASSLFISDKLIDTALDPKVITQSILTNTALQSECYRLLHSLFPPQSPFWQAWHQYLVDYTEACILEKSFHDQPTYNGYTDDIAYRIIIGKNGISRATINALAALSSQPSNVEPILQSLNAYNIATQLFDDLVDWKEDLAHNIPTLILQRAITSSGTIDPSGLSKHIYYQGHAVAILELALTHLAHSITVIEDIELGQWKNTIAKKHQECLSLKQDLERIIQQKRTQSNRPALSIKLARPTTEWQALAWQGVQYLLDQYRKGFPEVKHHMLFPYAGGFTGSSEYQSGDVFQRALIADIFCDIDILLNGQLQPVLEHEINYFVEQATPLGWSYFPDLPELPADADDLAQMIQVLWRTDRLDLIKAYCLKPLNELLYSVLNEDGSFETWIIPHDNRQPLHERQQQFVIQAWGQGPDIDVMANLLYAVGLYQPTLYVEFINNGIDYVEQHQTVQGAWLSTWYHGPFYGTYVCTRLLAMQRPTSVALPKAHSFLIQQQHSDGGWGLSMQSDPLSTALALLALAFTSQSTQEVAMVLDNGLRYLQTSQLPEQAWEKSLFIQMQLGRATGQVAATLSYGSQTITTAYVVKALLAWHQKGVEQYAQAISY